MLRAAFARAPGSRGGAARARRHAARAPAAPRTTQTRFLASPQEIGSADDFLQAPPGNKVEFMVTKVDELVNWARKGRSGP